MAFASPAEVDAAPRLPLPYGLFSVVSIAESSTERWENGVTWQALTCAPAGILVGDCNAPEGFPKQFNAEDGTGEAAAFTVYGTYKCSSLGNPLAFAQTRAREHLLGAEQWAVERRFWQTFDDAPTVLTGPNPGVALGLLEKFIGDNYGALGVIHASRNAATTLAAKQLIVARGNRMETVLGTPVAVGAGYPDTGVAGAAPAAGTAFIAATPAIFGYRSQVFEQTNRTGDLLDTAQNNLYGIAERNYLLGYDPCGVAIAAITLGS